MKHKSQKELKKFNDMLAIANICELVKQDKIKEAVEVAQVRNITPEQFGKIANMAELTPQEIYRAVFLKVDKQSKQC